MPSGARRSLPAIERSFRRALFGYRRADVDVAIAEWESDCARKGEALRAHKAKVERLGDELERARETADAREKRMRMLESELELERSHAAHRLRGLAVIGAEIEELRLAARGQATRIRLEALREAAAVSSAARQVADSPGQDEWLTAALNEAIDRLGRQWRDEQDASAERIAAPSSDEPVGESLGATGEPTANGAGARLPGSAAPSGAGDPVVEARVAPDDGGLAAANGSSRRLSVDIGPFRDFSQLVSFEDAANAIGATGEISIRRFSEGRASIDVSLSEPIDLLEELERRCDLDFKLRSATDEQIVLDLGE